MSVGFINVYDASLMEHYVQLWKVSPISKVRNLFIGDYFGAETCGQP